MSEEKKNTEKNVFKFDITVFIQNDMKRKILGQQEMEKNAEFAKTIEALRKGPREQRLCYIENLLLKVQKDICNLNNSAAMYKIASIELVLNTEQDIIQYRTMCYCLTLIHGARCEFTAAMIYAMLGCDECGLISNRSKTIKKECDQWIKICEEQLIIDDKQETVLKDLIQKQRQNDSKISK